jgi:shikimate kinase
MKIVLLGLKGVGKTTFGKKLAKLLNCPFIDTDKEIELKIGKKPSEIFIEEGEKKLREIECLVLCELQDKGDCVIAVGGGGFMQKESQKILKVLGTLICLHMNKKSLLERWKGWPAICKKKEEFDRYYDTRIQKLSELSCVWIDATRKDLLDLVLRVTYGK